MGASIRALLDQGPAASGLAAYRAEISARSRLDRVAAGGGELWFVIGGEGHLEADGAGGLPLHADRGLWLPAGVTCQVRAGDAADLRIAIVTLPAEERASAADRAWPLARDLRDCAVETTGDRQFRVLFWPATGCQAATQFVGEIPPGRAPAHSHPYDEIVQVLAGTGIAHVGAGPRVIGPGACLHLAPGEPHCLENDGTATLRVLGVFHPADSPAAKLVT